MAITSATSPKTETYMTARRNYKPGGSKEEHLSVLERRKQYNEEKINRSDKKKEADTQDAAGNLYRQNMANVNTELYTMYAKINKENAFKNAGINIITNANGTESYT